MFRTYWLSLLFCLGCPPIRQSASTESEHPEREELSEDESDGNGGGNNGGNNNGGNNGGGNGGDTGGSEDGGESETESAEDDAVVVAVDLPTHLDCGEVYPASVEIMNTGLATWTRTDGYKLGAVNDEDSMYGPDTRVWLEDDEVIEPGQSHIFEFDLTAPMVGDDYLTDWQMVHEGVRWFGESTSQTVAVSCEGPQTVCDPLVDDSLQAGFELKDVDGGSFSSSGWQTTGGYDQMVLELSTPIWSEGTLEIDVTNFDPGSQYSSGKHQIINMYTSDNGSQDVFESTEAWWNIRTGTNYGTGFKLLAAPDGGDSREEVRIIEDASWDPNDVHTFKVTWDSEEIHIYLDDEYLESLNFDGRLESLQHIFIGKDNVYVGQVGPIFSNLCVTW